MEKKHALVVRAIDVNLKYFEALPLADRRDYLRVMTAALARKYTVRELQQWIDNLETKLEQHDVV